MNARPPTLAALGVLAVVVVVVGIVAAGAFGSSRPAASGPVESAASADAGGPTGTPVPPPGLEVYGFVPYWEMDATIAAHLAGTDLTTLGLFSVTNKRNGSLDTSQRGYQRIAGPLGAQLIREAHDRGIRVELVFSSFGSSRNRQLFGAPIATQDKVIGSLVGFAEGIGVDGVNVDVEGLSSSLVTAYGDFVGRLRTALRAVVPDAQVSVATQANESGAAMAAAAAAATADRVFMMGYDYHVAGSQPGASAPIDRRDGALKDLVWSLDLYEALGVPVQRTILGLPLYGIAWPVTGPEVGAPATGKGQVWIPSDHLDVLHDATLTPTLDEIEQVEVYTLPQPGSSRGATAGAAGWRAIYVDTPATLSPKMTLANRRGLAGVGFWAVGYERGAPEYTDLIARFRKGELR